MSSTAENEVRSNGDYQRSRYIAQQIRCDLPANIPHHGWPAFPDGHIPAFADSGVPNRFAFRDVYDTDVRINICGMPSFFHYSEDNNSLNLSDEKKERLARCESIMIWDEIDVDVVKRKDDDGKSFEENIATLNGLNSALSMQDEGILLPNCRTITIIPGQVGYMYAGYSSLDDKISIVRSTSQHLLSQLIRQTTAVKIHEWDSQTCYLPRAPEGRSLRQTGTDRIESFTIHIPPDYHMPNTGSFSNDLVAGTHNILQLSQMFWRDEDYETVDECISWMANQFPVPCKEEEKDIPCTRVTLEGFLAYALTRDDEYHRIKWEKEPLFDLPSIKDRLKTCNETLRAKLALTAPLWKDQVTIGAGRLLKAEKNCAGCGVPYDTIRRPRW